MGDTLAKLKVILEASTASYKKEMEKAQKERCLMRLISLMMSVIKTFSTRNTLK